MRLIDLEAHFFTTDYVAYLRQRKASPRLETVEVAGQKEERLWLNEDLYALRTYTLDPLLDFEEVRLAEMDAAGVSMQVLTLGGPGCEPFESSEGVDMARRSNDELAKVIKKHPDRFVGFAAETQLHAYRLIYSGLFDKYPGLKIMLGHMGEGLPYWMFRMDYPWLSRSGGRTPLSRKPSDYVITNFIMTTSGMFYMPAFMCAYLALGAGNIVFASDYPFEKSTQAAAFMERIPICETDKERVCHGNAEALLKL